MAFKRRKRRLILKRRWWWAVWALSFLLVLVVLGRITTVFGSLDKKGYHWDGQSTINLVVKSELTEVVSFNPTFSTVTVLKLPDDLYLDIPGDFGKWPLRSIYGVGESEYPPRGMNLLTQTLRSVFAVPIDGYLKSKLNLPSLSAHQLLEKVRGNLPSGLILLGRIDTDLSTLELLRLFWGLGGVRADKVMVLDLGKSQITRSILLGDGSRALGLDQTASDQLLMSRFKDLRLEQEGLSVAVLNSTTEVGLADQAARMITNMGGRVVVAGNFEVKLVKSVVWGKESYTKERLSSIFAPFCLRENFLSKLIKQSPCRVDSQGATFERADVVVVVGEDAKK